MLREMADLGFGHVELSHGIRVSLVPGIIKGVREGIVQVSSTHNFCPLPPGITQAAPNLFEPSALDHAEHDQWLRHTRRSIEFAALVGAKVLVCHLGRVEFFWFNPARVVHRYLDEHPEAGRPGGDDDRYKVVLEKALKRLRKRLPPYWARVQASVREVLDFAAEKGVRLGIENREKFDELPIDEDLAGLLDELGAGAPVGYWHDTGHADIKEGMGLLAHRAHLARLAPRLMGFHLHDVSAHGNDHQAIGSGHIDFGMISEFWRPEHFLTLELSPRVPRDQVLSSRARVDELLRQRGLGA